ncbi:MAG: hypothetical protein WD852_10445 [Methyloceanibacter sp.]
MTEKIDPRIPISIAAGSSMINRHFLKSGGAFVEDYDLAELASAAEGVKDAAAAALRGHDLQMRNEMLTPIARQRAARKVAFDNFDKAARRVDAARIRVESELKKIASATSAPPGPITPVAQLREQHLLDALAMLDPKARGVAIHAAIESGDDDLVGAALRAHPLVSGMGKAEIEMRRHAWRVKRHPAAVDRETRLKKATADLTRMGSLLLAFVGNLTDAQEIARAEAAEQAALTASKVA